MYPADEFPVGLRCAVVIVRTNAVLRLEHTEYDDWVPPRPPIAGFLPELARRPDQYARYLGNMWRLTASGR